MRTGPAATLVATLAAALLPRAASAGEADWPFFRHDQGRTGRTGAVGAISEPAVLTSFATGGTLAANELRLGDLDGDGRADAAVVESGRISLRSLEGAVAWRSPALGITEIVGASDFDGDGRAELLAVGNGPPARLAVIDGRTGRLSWYFDAVPAGAANVRASEVLVADLTGDLLPEVVFSATSFDEDIRCFSFAGGFSADPLANLAWSRAAEHYDGNMPYVAGDVDLDGAPEVVLLQKQHLTILDGRTGAVERDAAGVFLNHSFGRLEIVETDGDPQPEIVALGWGYSYLFAVTVFDAVDGAVTWQYQWFPTELRGMSISANSVADLDGDGLPEIAVSLYGDGADEWTVVGSTPGDHDGIDAPGRWVLAVFSAADGSLIDAVPDAYLHGVAALDPASPPWIVAQRVPAGQRTIPRFGEVAGFELLGGALEELWSVPGAAPAQALAPNRPAAAMNVSDREVAAADLDGDGARELLLRLDADSDGAAEALAAFDVSGDDPVSAGWDALGSGEAVRLVAAGEGLSGPGAGPEAALFFGSGAVEVRGSGLARSAGFPVGALGASPIAADLDADGVNEVVATTSTGALAVLDASGAGATEPPEVLWSAPGSPAPYLGAVDAEGDGRLELLAVDDRDAVDPAVALLDADGLELWRHPFPGYGAAPAQIAFPRRADAGHDVALLIRDTRLPNATRERMVLLDGATGEEVWNVPRLSQTVAGPIHTAELDGDGWGDLILVGDSRNDFYDGRTGAVLGGTAHRRVCRQSWLDDFDLDGDFELLCGAPRATSGLTLYEAFATAATWSLPHDYDNEMNGRYPGFYLTGEGVGFVKPDPQGSLVAYAPDRSPSWGPVFLRGGAALAADPGDDLDVRYVTIADIDGDGGDDALAGTADGWLAAVRLSDGSLLWSLDLHGRVGEPVIADVDGDGLAEVLVTAADGALHVVGQAALGAPAEVRDVALDDGLQPVDEWDDVDWTEHRIALGAAWDAVPGASGYSVTFVDADGLPILPWIDVGGATAVAVPVAPLALGASFRAVVRPYGPFGEPGVEAVSDGLTIVDLGPPEIVDLDAKPQVFLPPATAAITAAARDATWIDAWRIEIAGGDGGAVRVAEGDGAGPTLEIGWIWDGRDDGGEPVDPGWYEIVLTVRDLAGHEATAKTKVRVRKPGR